MYVFHEGEIVFKERYGSGGNEIFYIKPPDQNVITILDDSTKKRDFFWWLFKIFLPQGYPESVSNDYKCYQIWDTAQAFCSTITGTLATQEVLRGVGVGSENTTPLAATITWVMRDACGHLGRILFAFSHGTYLDAYSKRWRLYADTLNDAAMCIEIALPLFKNFTTFALCVSSTMRAIVGVAGGATRTAMTQHHAIRGNIADVAAKDSAQETAVNLVASIAAVVLITFFGSPMWLFVLMIVLHITFNYFAVRAICLKTMNEARFLQIIDDYVKREVICSPCEVNRNEPIMFYHTGATLLDYKLTGFHIKLGGSLCKTSLQNRKYVYLHEIKNVYEGRNYILYPDVGLRMMYVFYRDTATTDDILCSYFHAALLSIVICAINDCQLGAYRKTDNPRPFADICHVLQHAEWSRNISEIIGRSGFRYEPSLSLTKFISHLVETEWNRVRRGLSDAGWDCSRHLLLVDEWRISSHTVTAREVRLSTEPVQPQRVSVLSYNDYPADLSHHDSAVLNENYTIEPEVLEEKPPVEDVSSVKDAAESTTQESTQTSSKSRSVPQNSQTQTKSRPQISDSTQTPTDELIKVRSVKSFRKLQRQP